MHFSFLFTHSFACRQPHAGCGAAERGGNHPPSAPACCTPAPALRTGAYSTVKGHLKYRSTHGPAIPAPALRCPCPRRLHRKEERMAQARPGRALGLAQPPYLASQPVWDLAAHSLHGHLGLHHNPCTSLGIPQHSTANSPPHPANCPWPRPQPPCAAASTMLSCRACSAPVLRVLHLGAALDCPTLWILQLHYMSS
jgi:hypothetical protein